MHCACTHAYVRAHLGTHALTNAHACIFVTDSPIHSKNLQCNALLLVHSLHRASTYPTAALANLSLAHTVSRTSRSLTPTKAGAQSARSLPQPLALTDTPACFMASI
eukprot:6114982-Pleurochrysis_carterae.AAC.1